MDRIEQLKVDIFEIIRKQDKLQIETNNLQRMKIEKVRELEKLEREAENAKDA